MFEITGKYNKAKIYAASTDSASYAQVLRMCNMEELANSTIAMMPDMHVAEGCTVGTSMTIGESINPAFVGSDIGGVFYRTSCIRACLFLRAKG